MSAITLNGYFPLFTTKSESDTAANGNGSHTHTFNRTTYWMPNNLGNNRYHGNFQNNGPFSWDGYYPLYLTQTAADTAANGNGSHNHTFTNFGTFYMPNNLGNNQYHGDYYGRVNLTIATGANLTIKSGAKIKIIDKTLSYDGSGTLTNNGTIFLDGTGYKRAVFKITDDVNISGSFDGNNFPDHQIVLISNSKSLNHSGSSGLAIDTTKIKIEGLGSYIFTYKPVDRMALSNAIDDFIDNNSLSYGDINNWNVGDITDFSYAFRDKDTFNSNISGWDVSKGLDFTGMFTGCSEFDQDIGDWVMENATSMKTMFSGCAKFNQDIGNWDIRNVVSLQDMFLLAEKFNQDISKWDVSNVKSFEGMFESAVEFNQNLMRWDVSNGGYGVTNGFVEMFKNAYAFNQDLRGWNINEDLDDSQFDNMFQNNTHMSNYGFSTNVEAYEFNRLTDAIVKTRNTGNGEWKNKKADLRLLTKKSGFHNQNTPPIKFKPHEIFGKKSNGTSRVPAALENKDMQLAKMSTTTPAQARTPEGRADARKHARQYNRQPFSEAFHAPLAKQGDCVCFTPVHNGVEADNRVIEIGIKTEAKNINDTATYEWYIMSNTTNSASIISTGLKDVPGESIVTLTISVTDTFGTPDSITVDHTFYLGSVTSGGSSLGGGSSGSGGGDPYIIPVIGPIYKLPDMESSYRFYENKASKTIINTRVSYFNKNIATQKFFGNYSTTLINKGFWFDAIYINVNNNICAFDLKGWKWVTNKKGVDFFEFKPILKYNKESNEWMNKGKCVSMEITWKTETNENTGIIIQSYKNPQIANNIKMKNANMDNSYGLCVRNYKPRLTKINKFTNILSIEPKIKKAKNKYTQKCVRKNREVWFKEGKVYAIGPKVLN